MKFIFYLLIICSGCCGILVNKAAGMVPKLPTSIGVVAEKSHPIQRSFTSNGLEYSFLIIPVMDSTGSENQTAGTIGKQVMIKFRISIAGWNESPFRYGLATIEEYEERIKFFSFSFNQHIHLYQDSIQCGQTGYNLDANLNAAPFETFVLSFLLNKGLLGTGLILTIDDPILYKGAIEILLSKEDLQ